MRKLMVLLTALLALWAVPAEAVAFKGYYYNAKSTEEIAALVEASLAKDATGNTLIAPEKCRADGSCATPAAYLESINAHDPEAKLTSVNQVAGYLRSLVKDCTVSGDFEMDAMDIRPRTPRARVSVMHRRLRPGECVFRNPKTGRIVLAEHCANPIGRALDNPCVYVDFLMGPERAAHVGAVDATDKCLAWRSTGALGAREDGTGWKWFAPNQNPACSFADAARVSGQPLHCLGEIPGAPGTYQVRMSANNYAAICLEYATGSSFTAGIRRSDFRQLGTEQHARVYYQSSELPSGVKATDDAALFFWASTPEEEARIHARFGQ